MTILEWRDNPEMADITSPQQPLKVMTIAKSAIDILLVEMINKFS